MSWKLADLGPRQPVIYLILIYANENKLSKYISSLGPGHHDGGNIIIISPNSSFFYSYDLKRWTTFLHRQYASQNLLSQFFDLWGVDVNDHDYTIAQRWLVHVCTFICCWLYSHTMLAHRQRSSLWVQHRLQQLRQADKYLPRDKDAAWWRFCPLTDSRQGNLHTETSILRIKRPWRVKIWPTTDIFDTGSTIPDRNRRRNRNIIPCNSPPHSTCFFFFFVFTAFRCTRYTPVTAAAVLELYFYVVLSHVYVYSLVDVCRRYYAYYRAQTNRSMHIRRESTREKQCWALVALKMPRTHRPGEGRAEPALGPRIWATTM